MSASVVPFHEAKLSVRESVTLTDGIVYKVSDTRRVEVWRIKDAEGFCVRIFRETNDGKTSKLMFGLTPDGAAALATALSVQLGRKTK